jgi:phosphatidylserine decarboxylase
MIAPEGWPFILIPLCAAVAAAALGWVPAALIFGGFATFSAFFFRNPDRSCDADPEVLCSPADGRIITVGDAPEGVAPDGLPIQVSVFMSVFNVHVNRAPMDGSLIEYAYNPGKMMAAYKDKASLLNEQNFSLWQGPAGRVALKQIAGLIARRIVFDHATGAAVKRGDRIGLIRFGSRVDVFLPADAEILVTLGDRVKAGNSPLARLVRP